MTKNAIATDRLAEMQTAALELATKLRTRASDIERAAQTILCIARDQHRCETLDGPAWDMASRVLREAGIPVPISSLYTWGE